MPTRIDYEKLEQAKARLPKRLHLFMDNFFGTCQGIEPHFNYLNYMKDIRLYGRTTRAYREHAPELIEAFYDITGWKPGRDP